MGVDSRLYLPGNVRVRDVATVLGILFGLPSELELLNGDACACRVQGANVTGCPALPETARIDLKRPNGDHVAGFFYHFENPGGRRLVSGRARAEVIAAFKAAADFFGGRLDYTDCDNEDANYVVPDKSDEDNHAEDGPEWDAFQRRMYAVKPMSRFQIQECADVAAY